MQRDLKLETVRGTRLPYRPIMTRPSGVESEQRVERVSPRVRLGRE